MQAALSRADGTAIEAAEGKKENVERCDEDESDAMSALADMQVPATANGEETTDGREAACSNIEGEAGKVQSSPAPAEEYLNSLEADSKPQDSALTRLILRPTSETDLPITVAARTQEEKDKYGWIRLRSWPNWATFYWDINLKDVSSVNIMIQRFDMLLERLDNIVNETGFFVKCLMEADLPPEVMNSTGVMVDRPVPYAQIPSVRDKMIYEKGQLQKQKRFLVGRKGVRPVSPLFRDLVDVHNSPIDISFYDGKRFSAGEREAMEKAFKIDTLCGAAQAIAWVTVQIDILRASPLHYQNDTPYRHRKSTDLKAVEKLKYEWLAKMAKLKSWEEVASEGIHTRVV